MGECIDTHLHFIWKLVYVLYHMIKSIQPHQNYLYTIAIISLVEFGKFEIILFSDGWNAMLIKPEIHPKDIFYISKFNFLSISTMQNSPYTLPALPAGSDPISF